MRQYAAARNLRGSLPFEVRRQLYQMRFRKNSEVQDEPVDANPPKDEVAA